MYQRKLEKVITCPLEYGLDVFSVKWKSRILCVVNRNGKLRHKDFKDLLPGITDPVLSSVLKELMANGMIVRHQFDEIPPRVEYTLTEKGKKVIPVLQEICAWSSEYSARDESKEMDHCHACTVVGEHE